MAGARGPLVKRLVKLMVKLMVKWQREEVRVSDADFGEVPGSKRLCRYERPHAL